MKEIECLIPLMHSLSHFHPSSFIPHPYSNGKARRAGDLSSQKIRAASQETCPGLAFKLVLRRAGEATHEITTQRDSAICHPN
jgi:hypothetical protein